MAKKRALIDAVLSATRSSCIFTQDIEDFPNQTLKRWWTVTKRQLLKIHQIVAELNMRHEVAKEMMQMKYHVDHNTKLSKKQASDFIQDLLHLKDVFNEEENLNMQNDKKWIAHGIRWVILCTNSSANELIYNQKHLTTIYRIKCIYSIGGTIPVSPFLILSNKNGGLYNEQYIYKNFIWF